MANTNYNNNRTYFEGAWIRRVWASEDKSREILSFGIKVEEFIKQLQKTPPNDNGIVNLTICSQKEDNNKFSLFYEPYNPNKGGTSNKDKSPSTSSDSDDLPF